MKRHQVGDIFVNKITSPAYKKGTVVLTNHRKIKHFYKNHKLNNLRIRNIIKRKPNKRVQRKSKTKD